MLDIRVSCNRSMLNQNLDPSSRLFPAITWSVKFENDSEDNILELTTLRKSWFSQKGSKNHLRNSVLNIENVSKDHFWVSLFL